MSAVQLYRELFPALARTATPPPSSWNDYSHTRVGGHIVIRTSAIGAAPSVVPVVEAQDPLSQQWYPLLTGAAIVAVGLVVLRIYPGVAAVANLSVADFIPPIWRLSMTHSNGDSITYSASANLRE
jgi:hypothetical protein